MWRRKMPEAFLIRMKHASLFTLLAVPLLATDSFHLAENGKALVPIVISAKASEQTKAVAAELAGYLERISGAKFEVTAGDGTKGIVLGTKDEFQVSGYHPDDLITRNTYDGRESFVIDPGDERLLMLRRVLKLLPQVEDTTSDEDEGHE